MDIFSGIDLWESIGPLIITGIAVAFIGVFFYFVIKNVENSTLRSLLSIAAVVLIIATLLVVILYTSASWGSR
ncbi:hypothetical protein EHV15_29505 [Paenibacillus oralis]|uniref:Uncharacterized protein n=1 Tax=Paenibacillus oralis TaxID=2490856 RepID=A0A3P3U8C0_9BACL|nr:hypothetical protein [Paenibacillus oralis]RRJ66602.1 hypothetical protein EHV15_29505 [Paenibacillus oralis]